MLYFNSRAREDDRKSKCYHFHATDRLHYHIQGQATKCLGVNTVA